MKTTKRGGENLRIVITLLTGLLLLAGIAAPAGAADTVAITGTISMADGRPVENVAVYVDSTLAALSDSSGKYMAPAVEAGDHRVQPVKEGLTFVPGSRQVTLPPEAAGIDFTAFTALGGADSTDTLQAAPVEQTPWQKFTANVKRLMLVIQQLYVLMLLLSAGAFLALAARRLRSGEWSLSFLFQRPQTAAPLEEHWQEESGAEAEGDWEEALPEAAPAPVEEAFEVVESKTADTWMPIPEVPQAEAEAAPAVVPPTASRRRAGRLAVRPFELAGRQKHAAPRGASAAPAVRELLQQGMALAQAGDLAQAEAILRQVIQQDDAQAEAWFWLGTVKQRQGETRTAERCYARAVRLVQGE